MSNQREKYYVCEKRMNTNEIIVCSATHPALFKQEVVISPKDMVWINPKSLSLIYSQCKQDDHVFPIQCQLRYQNTVYPCRIEEVTSEEIRVHSLQPMRAVTKGQVCVFYDHEECLQQKEH